MSEKYETRVTRITVMPEGEPVFSECATNIEIEDEASGEFVKVSQGGVHGDASKFIMFCDRAEWTAIRSAVDTIFNEIENRDSRKKALGK